MYDVAGEGLPVDMEPLESHIEANKWACGICANSRVSELEDEVKRLAEDNRTVKLQLNRLISTMENFRKERKRGRQGTRNLTAGGTVDEVQ